MVLGKETVETSRNVNEDFVHSNNKQTSLLFLILPIFMTKLILSDTD